METLQKGTRVSIRTRKGEVLFGKYVKEGRNGYHTIETTDGKKYDRKFDKIKVLSDQDVDFKTTETTKGLEVEVKGLTPPKQFDINQKFNFLENMVKMVIKGTAVSMIITGERRL